MQKFFKKILGQTFTFNQTGHKDGIFHRLLKKEKTSILPTGITSPPL